MTMPAATDSAAEILQRNITALNNRDLETYLSNQHPDVTITLPGGVQVHGRDQVRASTQVMFAAFPDGKLQFGEQVLADDAAATEVVFTGTHTGPLATPAGEVPPTGRAVRTTTVSMLRFRDGMILTERVIGDELELARQLGLSTPNA
ncbi:ester cyclase [Kribbella sp. VKM Ac-2566]|jgi:predicted ester cyclase|uniref:ester cyclase n=1 Tax=Kribbella sp. VKM Ac-2566 TaxID=2512218 RepID=UPI00106271F6|nr:ester cyclase [Kribbella sp. VKM Ac-2566]TDW79473.1 putative ester cyclase [Kribbella sp. VKM Ac-2566]